MNSDLKRFLKLICTLTCVLGTLGGCTYDSQSLNAVRCDVPNQRDGDRICKNGVWVQADGQLDSTSDLPDMTDMPVLPDMPKPDMTMDMQRDIPTDMVRDSGMDMERDIPTDMVMVDMNDMPVDMCTPLEEAEICKNIDKFMIQCGQATVVDNCGMMRDIDCGDNCPFERCKDNKCPACVPVSNTELCKSNMYTCGKFTVPDNCGMMRDIDCGDAAASCNADEICNAAKGECECPPVDCSNTVCGEASNACGSTQMCPDTCAAAMDDTVCNAQANSCDCPSAQVLCPANAQCGEVTNKCGDTAQCGSGPLCAGEQVCVGFRCVDVTLTPPDNATGGFYGWSVAMDGDTLVVGEPNLAVNNTSGVGRAHVYVRDPATNGWSLQTTLLPPANERVIQGFFGWSVAIDGDILVVGMNGADRGNDFAVGAVFAYKRTGTTWGSPTKIKPSQLNEFSRLGHAVAVNGTTIYAGAPGQNFGSSMVDDVGIVYEFACDANLQNCVRRAISLPGNQHQGRMAFGASLQYSQNHLLIGAPMAENGTRLGLSYVYENVAGNWTRLHKLQLADRTASQQGGGFGFGAAMAWPNVIVGQAGFDDITIGIFTNRLNAPGKVILQDLSAFPGGANSVINFGPDENNMMTNGTLLERPARSNADGHGISIAISGDILIAGAFDVDQAMGNDQGEVNVWELQNGVWTRSKTITPASAATGQFFGRAVSTNGSFAAVGAFGADIVHLYQVK